MSSIAAAQHKKATARPLTPATHGKDEHEVFRRLRAATKAAGYDALVALSQDNVTYTAGFLVPSHATNRFRRTISILAGDSFASQIVVSVEEKQAVARSRFADVRSYDQFADDPADVLADALIEAGVAEGRIAVELDYMPARDFLRLRERLPRAVFEECKEIYFRTRMIKTDEEVGILRRIGLLTERVIHDSLKEVRVGMTEIDVARRVVDQLIAGGSTNFKYRFGSGVNSSVTNCGTTHKKIEAGDIIRIEVLGELDNYRSNVTRTAVVGRPTDRQRDIFASLVRAREICKTMIRPGLPVADLYRTYVTSCRESGIEPTLKFLGHGIGQTIHEEPYITDTRDIVFEPNITFTMEPLYMIPGEMGFHAEDMYVITRDGFDFITGDICKNDELIQVG
ncbi:putative dipeptidase PepE [Rhodoplanes serenus]|jgi:Xaa-Pro aminopeptidase|uniref:Dipeptidase PepE n=1 Tax=Rhodoplanes serenus TaxID=200615 RepID=A0A447D017_9BRAD|nr:Xaa-Pro peptidase family protein [Rhodoplanes serenus]MBI5113096.1 aminopeptidase P family protein [Rhodovulum sp.]VCU10869.1 putative dipeptidase PepE [Rhodoplanes serenus]